MGRRDKTGQPLGEVLFINFGLGVIGAMVTSAVAGVLFQHSLGGVAFGLVTMLPGGILGMVVGTPLGVFVNSSLRWVPPFLVGSFSGIVLAWQLSEILSGLGGG
jgi:hypothetical protein